MSKSKEKTTDVAAVKAVTETKVKEEPQKVDANTFISMQGLNFADTARVKYIEFHKNVKEATVEQWKKLLKES